MPVKHNEREYRLLASNLEVREQQEENTCKVRGYATTFNDPYTLYSGSGYTFREQVDPKAFEECDMADVIMQYDHRGRVFARTSNNTLSLTVDERGLLIEADLGGTETGRQLYEEIKGGYTTKMSFGFHVAEDSEVRTEDKASGNIDYLRTITRIDKLYDVSAVSLPANDATEISARSYADGVISKDAAERLQRENQKKKLRILMEV